MAGRGLVHSGARARFTINGTKVMYATGVSYGEEIQHDPVEPLDQFEVAEHVPVAYRINLSAEFVRVIKNPIKNRDGVTIFPKLADILNAEEMTCTVEDPKTGTVLANIERVKCQSYRVQTQARGIVMTNCEFVGIQIKDESEIA